MAELGFDLFPAALKHVHGYMRLLAVFERDQGVAHFDGFL